MIIVRYFFKEILLTFLAVSFVLLGIALSNKFVFLLAKSATGELPLELLLKVVALHVPELIAMIMPLGLFVAILLAKGRMYTENEITILATAGFTWSKMTTIILWVAFGIAILNGLLTLWILPSTAEYKEAALREGEALGMLQGLTPGRFQVMNDGQLVVYVEDIMDNSRHMKGVFIAEQPITPPTPVEDWTLLVAQSAKLQKKETTGDRFLILEEGERYSGVPGQQDYTIVQFQEYGREIKKVVEPVPVLQRIKPTSILWNSNEPDDVAELQWRISVPVSILILALFSISLAKVQPRQGRFSKFLPAILLYILYYNGMIVCRRWIVAKTIPSFIGLWGVHLCMVVLAFFLLAKASGRLNQIRFFYKRKF